MKNLGHIIDGNIVNDNQKSYEIFNPSNGNAIATISNASEETIEKAIMSSKEAFEEWKSYSIAKRASIIFEYKILLEKNIDKLAKIIGEDLGKVYDDAIGEIRRGIENVEYPVKEINFYSRFY